MREPSPTTAEERRNELYALRQQLGMTQQELGEALALGGQQPGQNIYRYEAGLIMVPPRILSAVRNLLALQQQKG